MAIATRSASRHRPAFSTLRQLPPAPPKRKPSHQRRTSPESRAHGASAPFHGGARTALAGTPLHTTARRPLLLESLRCRGMPSLPAASVHSDMGSRSKLDDKAGVAVAADDGACETKPTRFEGRDCSDGLEPVVQQVATALGQYCGVRGGDQVCWSKTAVHAIGIWLVSPCARSVNIMYYRQDNNSEKSPKSKSLYYINNTTAPVVQPSYFFLIAL